MKYAYVDKGGVFHITKDEKIAESHGREGKYLPTEIEAKGGYPYNKHIEYIVYYGGDEVKRPEMLKYVTPEMRELYEKLK